MSPEQQRGEPAGPPADVYAIAMLASDLLDIAESNGVDPSRDEHAANAITWATQARTDQRCQSTITLAEAFETSTQTAKYRLIPRVMLPITAAAIVTAAASPGLGDARNVSPVDRQGSSKIQELLLTDAAISETARSSLSIARAQIDRVKTMTDAAIIQLAEPEPIANASRQLLDALGLACWTRGMDKTATTFFDQGVIAAQREGLGPTDPKWHRQIQLQAEAQIRTGGFLEATAIIDDATARANADHSQPIGPAIASVIRSPLLRLWWTRAIAMDRLGDHAAAADLLTRVLDAQLADYPDHTDWIDSLGALTQILVDTGRDDDARQMLTSHPVPRGIQDASIYERHNQTRSSADQNNAFQGR